VLNRKTKQVTMKIMLSNVSVYCNHKMSIHHHHHHADIYNAPTKQEHRCSTKIQIVVDETYWTYNSCIS